MENVYLSYSLQEGPPGSKDLPMFWRGPQGPANKEENKEENMWDKKGNKASRKHNLVIGTA